MATVLKGGDHGLLFSHIFREGVDLMGGGRGHYGFWKASALLGSWSFQAHKSLEIQELVSRPLGCWAEGGGFLGVLGL